MTCFTFVITYLQDASMPSAYSDYSKRRTPRQTVSDPAALSLLPPPAQLSENATVGHSQYIIRGMHFPSITRNFI